MGGNEQARRAFVLPTMQLHFSYVLILEWLDAGDDQTGSDLHAYQPRSFGLVGFSPTSVTICGSTSPSALCRWTRSIPPGSYHATRS